MTGGWIKLYRQLLEKPIWQESTPEQKVILITLLSMANHEEKEWEWQGEPYKASPGQFVTSLESIKRKCGKGISMQNVRTALKRFEKYEFLTNKPTNKNRLITIVNWEVYQSKDVDLTKEVTSNSQATNKQLTTNKNYKNYKNEKNNNIHDGNSPLQEIVQNYESIFGMINSFVFQNLEQWCEDLSPELVLEALKRSKSANNFKYTENILKNWDSRGVKTVTDVENIDTEFKQRKGSWKKPTRSEPVPEWLDDPEGYNARKEAELMQRANDDLPF